MSLEVRFGCFCFNLRENSLFMLVKEKEQVFGIVDLLGVVERAELFKQLLRNQRCIPVEDLFQLNVLIGIVPDQFFR